MSNQSVNGFQGSQPSHLKYNKSFSIIPQYVKKYRFEYIFIKLVEEELEYFIDNINDLNNGLFKSNKAKEIKKLIKSFLEKQESGEFKNINGLEIKEKDISNLIKIKKMFDCWKLRYDACNGVSDSDEDCGDVNEVVYPGFGKLYNLFKIFLSKIVIWYENSDSDDDYSEFENVKIILPVSDDDSDDDSDSD